MLQTTQSLITYKKKYYSLLQFRVDVLIWAVFIYLQSNRKASEVFTHMSATWAEMAGPDEDLSAASPCG